MNPTYEVTLEMQNRTLKAEHVEWGTGQEKPVAQEFPVSQSRPEVQVYLGVGVRRFVDISNLSKEI